MKRKWESARKRWERQRKRRLVQDVAKRKERRLTGESVLLTGQVTMPVEIQELGRIVDEANAPSPPAVEWTST